MSRACGRPEALQESPCALCPNTLGDGPRLFPSLALPSSSLPFSVQPCAAEADLSPCRRGPGSLVPWLLVGIIERETRARDQGVKGERGGAFLLLPPLLGTTSTGGEMICPSPRTAPVGKLIRHDPVPNGAPETPFPYVLLLRPTEGASAPLISSLNPVHLSVSHPLIKLS